MRVLLERDHLPSVVVQDVDEGLKTLVESGEPFLVLVDHAPPDSDGLRMLDAVRTDSRWESLPVVLVTAGADEVFVREAISLGANGILSKPFRAPALVQAVRRARDQGFLVMRDQREVAHELGLDLRGYQQFAREVAGQITDLFTTYRQGSNRTTTDLEADLRSLDEALFQFGAYRALSELHATLRRLSETGIADLEDDAFRTLAEELRRFQATLLAAA